MSSITIGIDLRVLVLGKRTGVEEYLLNVLPRMIAGNPEITFRLFYNAFRKPKFQNLDISKYPNVEICSRSIPNRPLFALNALFNWPKIDKLMGGCDMFWSPHILNVALSSNVRHVITVHDLAFERYPEFFSKEKLWWHKYLMAPKRRLRHAHHILTVSQSTKSDLEHLYKIPGEKITVTPLGVGSEFMLMAKIDTRLAAVQKKYHLPEHFILYFGTIEPRKNITGLIQAFEILKSYKLQATSYKLVIAGSRGWLYEEIFDAARRSPHARDIHFTGFIENEDKPALYNLADVFVYPSFFEGFGLPVLEAMACGVPVITANRSSLPEVAGGAALLVDPYRTEELSTALENVLGDEALRNALSEKGSMRTKTFSWDYCADASMSALLPSRN